MFLSLSEDLSSREVLFNKVWLQGLILTGVFYGIVVTLGLSCLHLLRLSAQKESSQSESQSSRRPNIWLQIYVVFLLAFSTVFMVLKGIEVEDAYLNHSDYPGGPATFISENVSAIPVVKQACFVLLQWASDGLLLWTCLSFFSAATCGVGWTQIVLALLSFINIVLSAMPLMVIVSPHFFGRSGFPLSLLYGFYTLFLNIGITLAIVIRLLRHRRAMIKLFGPKYGGFYLGVISVFFESAAIIIAYDLFYLIPAVLRSPLSGIGQVGVMVQIIPPLMVIRRVAQGIDSIRQIQSSEVAIGSLSVIEFVMREPESSPDEIIICSIT